MHLLNISHRIILATDATYAALFIARENENCVKREKFEKFGIKVSMDVIYGRSNEKFLIFLILRFFRLKDRLSVIFLYWLLR